MIYSSLNSTSPDSNLMLHSLYASVSILSKSKRLDKKSPPYSIKKSLKRLSVQDSGFSSSIRTSSGKSIHSSFIKEIIELTNSSLLSNSNLGDKTTVNIYNLFKVNNFKRNEEDLLLVPPRCKYLLTLHFPSRCFSPSKECYCAS